MFDPAILLSLEAPMPPQMPAMVIEQTWRSADGDRVEWVGRRYADAFDATADAWAADYRGGFLSQGVRSSRC